MGGGRGCYAGRPISVKCPKCKRGKYGFERPERGLKIGEQKRNPRPRTHRSTTLTQVNCLDCGHWWWTTLLTSRQPRGTT